MKKVLVLGAGAQGGPCASILARDKDVSAIVLADINIDLANKVKDKIKSDKITTMKVDAGKIEDIEKAASGVDAIINLALPRFNPNVLKAALSSKAHYADAALSMFGPTWNQLIQNKPLEFDNEFKEAGLTAVFACGGTPGVTNVLARRVCDKLDRVDEIHVKLGGKALEEPKELVTEWSTGWCPDEALENYEDEVDIFEKGKYKRYPPFSAPEKYNFPEPVGTVLVTRHTHEEGVTPPRFIGKGLKHCDFKYPFDPIAGALVKLKLTNKEPVDVNGVKVAPKNLLMKLMKAPVNEFLLESETTAKLPPKSVHFMVIEIKGARSGKDVTYKLMRPSATPEENLRLYRKFGTIRIGVALPAIVAIKMGMRGDAPRGLIAPECLDPTRFLKIMADMGAPVKFQELCSSEVSV